MGKSKKKPKASAEKTAIRAAKKQAKRAARESSGVKKPHKVARASIIDLKIKTPSARAAEALSHVKWGALFKKHIGVLESHVKHLERVQQSVQGFMLGLPEVERGEWERGEKGSLHIIAGCVERAKETVKNAKGAVSLLPGHKAASATKSPLPATTDEDGDSEMEDVSSSSEEDEESAVEEVAASPEVNGTVVVEANPYFVVDTNPTPVVVDTSIPPILTKKSKKREKDDDTTEKEAKKIKKAKRIEISSEPALKLSREPGNEALPEEPQSIGQTGSRKSKKSKKNVQPQQTTTESPVDFSALQAKLQAEVDIGEAAKEVEAHAGDEKSKKDKKRRRSSDGLSKEGKKARKEEKERKRKADDEGMVVGRKRKS